MGGPPRRSVLMAAEAIVARVACGGDGTVGAVVVDHCESPSNAHDSGSVNDSSVWSTEGKDGCVNTAHSTRPPFHDGSVKPACISPLTQPC